MCLTISSFKSDALLICEKAKSSRLMRMKLEVEDDWRSFSSTEFNIQLFPTRRCPVSTFITPLASYLKILSRYFGLGIFSIVLIIFKSFCKYSYCFEYIKKCLYTKISEIFMAPSCVTFINIKKEQSIQKGLQSQGLQPFFDGLYVFSYITSLPRIRRRRRGLRRGCWTGRRRG